MDLTSLVPSQYLPYAKATIVSRAIPSLDGMKPVNRRILYVMYNDGLWKPDADQVKSATIVGKVMKYHPNGDSSIYGALVTQASGREGMNIPFVKSKGNFGKIYSTTAYAAPRYTEAKLTPAAEYLFDGIKENGAEMVKNFDNSLDEPKVLPTKFPNILCNPSDGIAVSTSSSIPPFNLKKVCEATKGIIKGEIETVEQLAPVIGIPDFTTGGYIHISNENLVKLLRDGRGSMTLSCALQLYRDKFVVDQLPYGVSIEEVRKSIIALVKEKTIQGVADVSDEMDIRGLKLTVSIKQGYDVRKVALELLRSTDLRKKLSFRIRVLINDRCEELGVLELLQEWIKFRKNTLDRIYTYRLSVQTKKEEMQSLWEKISNHIKDVVNTIANNTQDKAAELLMSKYGLTVEQAAYVLDLKLKQITTDQAQKALKQLAELRTEIAYSKKVLSDDNEKNAIIIKDLDEVATKFGKEPQTQQRDEINDEAEKNVSRHVVNDDIVTVVLTNTGYLKRLEGNSMYVDKYESRSGEDVEVQRWMVRNNEYMLIFDRNGTVHKVLVDDIDAGRGKPCDKVIDLAGIEKLEDVIYIDKSGDFTDSFFIVMTSGIAYSVKYSKISGKRSKYKSLYEPLAPNTYFITKCNKFFLFTNTGKAAFAKLDMANDFDKKTWKIARCTSGEYFNKLLPYEKVFRINAINVGRYCNGYPVKVKDEIIFFFEDEFNKEQERLRKCADGDTEENANTDTAENNADVSESNVTENN